MTDKAVAALRELQKAKADIAGNASVFPAFDEMTLLTLERRHLEVPAFAQAFVEKALATAAQNTTHHIQNAVRLMRVAEVAFDADEPIHLPGVESAITAMRERGCSLLFLVQGDARRTVVYLGVSRYAPGAEAISAIGECYEAVWKANFPGTDIAIVPSEEAGRIAHELSRCSEIGALTGIPSLKRSEQVGAFVQGLERLVRAMRGRTYSWLTIADPIPPDAIRFALDQCRSLQSDIHQLVKTDISKASSNGRMITLGLFGMGGRGDTQGTASSQSGTTTTGTTTATTLTEGTSNSAGGSVHGGLPFFGGGINYNRVWSRSSSATTGTLESLSMGWVNTISDALTTQLGGGGFASFGMSWTKTTTVGQEFLNRKAAHTEEVLKAYEKRLTDGIALGMWNLGQYFCAEDPETYRHGIGVVTSLFSGMDSHYEPPRTIKLPTEFASILRRFENVYLKFENKDTNGQKSIQDHPLGYFFNGPATPVNTQELAVATPVAVRDIEGVSVSQRPSFGINVPVYATATKSLTLGTVLDKGNETRQRYRLAIHNLPKHVAVFGLTGAGKTNTVKHLLTQLWKVHRTPFLVIEPAKAEYRTLASHPDLRDDVLVVSAGVDTTSACPLRLNPFDFEPGLDRDANRVHVLTHIDRLKATFNASFPMYASMPYILEEAMLEIYRERGWNLGRSMNSHCNIYAEEFRDYIPTLRDLFFKVETITRKKGYFVEQQMNIEAALKARLSSLMVGAKGTMLNCARSIPAPDLFSRPCIIELEHMGDDDEKAFVMGLLVAKLYEYRKSTFHTGADSPSGLRHVVVIEEAHRLLTNVSENTQNAEVANVKGKAVSAFVDMLSEIRAFGQSVVVVDQLPSRVSPNIVKGTGSKVIHRLLAKDDREAVGWTLGLNDDQIADLCLLRTGECVTSQDGDRKAFLCKVTEHEAQGVGGERELTATAQYKANHRGLFEDKAEGVDLEDFLFKDNLHKAMLAVAAGEPGEQLLSGIRPSLGADWAQEYRGNWLETYWGHICAEIWSFYEGSYGTFIAMKKAGRDLLLAEPKHTEAVARYRDKFAAYIRGTKIYLFDFAPTAGVIGAIYEQLFLRHKLIERLNAAFDSTRERADGPTRLASALRKVLPLLLPASVQSSDHIRKVLAAEIVARLRLNFPVEGLIELTIAGDKNRYGD